jgi:hypothetical protein
MDYASSNVIRSRWSSIDLSVAHKHSWNVTSEVGITLTNMIRKQIHFFRDTTLVMFTSSYKYGSHSTFLHSETVFFGRQLLPQDGLNKKEDERKYWGGLSDDQENKVYRFTMSPEQRYLCQCWLIIVRSLITASQRISEEVSDGRFAYYFVRLCILLY